MEKHLLRASLMAHQIVRWHMVGQYPRQDIAQHSFRVAFIAAHIADKATRYGMQGLDGNRAFVLAACHDLGETVTGDIPSHVKSAVLEAGVDIDVLGEQKGFTDVPEPYKWIVKSADVLEAYLFTQAVRGTTDDRGQQIADFVAASWDGLLLKYCNSINRDDGIKWHVLKGVFDDLDDALNFTHDYNLQFRDKSSD